MSESRRPWQTESINEKLFVVDADGHIVCEMLGQHKQMDAALICQRVNDGENDGR